MATITMAAAQTCPVKGDIEANVYAAGVFVPPEGYERDARPLEGYAKQYSMVVLLANYGAPTGGLPSAGKSAIWDDRGKQLAVADDSGEALVIARLARGEWSGRVLGL